MSEDQVDQIGSAPLNEGSETELEIEVIEPAATDRQQLSSETGIVQKAEEVVEQIHDKAGQVVGRAKDFLDHQIGQRTKKTAVELGQLAKSLLNASEQLADSFAAPYVQKLGNGIENVANVLKDASVAEAVRRAESYGRENPLLFLGGALLAGLAGGRVLKSAHSAVADGLLIDADADDEVEVAPTKQRGARGKARRASHSNRAGAA